MIKMTIIAALTLAVLTSEASAQTDSSATTTVYVNADTLHEWCQQQPARALFYVAGVLDALMLMSNAPVCIPAESNLAQPRDVMCKYLRDNPAKRHYNTASSIWLAQSQAWPCKK
jgi:hypothetical protein